MEYPFQKDNIYMISIDDESLLTVIFKERNNNILTLEIIEEETIEKVNEEEETFELESVSAEILGTIWLKEENIRFIWFKHDSITALSFRLGLGKNTEEMNNNL